MKKLLLVIGLFLPLLGFAQESKIDGEPSDAKDEVTVAITGISDENLSGESGVVRLNNLLTLKENEVKKLKEDNEILQDLNNQLSEDKAKALRNNLRLASMFIYAPYNEMLINDYAIKTFNTAQKQQIPEYNDSENQVVLELLTNYKKDCEVVDGIFQKAKEIKDKGNALNLADQLEMSSPYTRYQKYEYWDETYLGNIMNSLLRELRNYSPNNSPKKINDLGSGFFANWNQQKNK